MFEERYKPTKLGNWEYPKWYPERPRQRFKPTKIIADNNGRLLEGVKKENPWGNYVGTWDLPRRITKEYVKKLVAPPERLVKLWENKKKEPETITPVQATAETEEKGECLPILDQSTHSSAGKSFERRNKSCSALDLRQQPTKLEPLLTLQERNENVNDIKPGTLDEKIKNIIESVKDKEKSVFPSNEICNEIKALPHKSRKKIDPILCQESKENDKNNYSFLNCADEHLNKFEKDTNDEENEKDRKLIEFDRINGKKEESSLNISESLEMKDDKKSLEPLKNGISGFQIAKRFHDENLKHKPLPDVIDDPVFKALTSGRQPNAGGTLNVQPGPSAIGYKYYTAPGPTECSKLKVYRPKTAIDKVKLQKELRPKTGGLNSTFKRRFLPIDLAICWDLKPDDPSDEPKRTPHIDGSNGSAAPAVFTMIHPTEAIEENQNIPGSFQAVAEKITKGIDEDNIVTLPSQLNGKNRSPMSISSNREAIMSCVKSPQENIKMQKLSTPGSINSISPNAAEYARRNPKTAWTTEDTSKALSNRLQSLQKENERHSCEGKSPTKYQSEPYQLEKKKHHQSTPNLATVCEGSHCGTEKNSPASSKLSELSKERNYRNSKVIGSESRLGSASGDRIYEPLKNQKNGTKKNRNCSACEKTNSEFEEPREKTEFKSAFKAGVPKSESSNSNSSCTTKTYKVPKMRLPYAKKNYSINTLAPPFSLWRENNGQEYPEHWRLASVYQHSYKPINTRKRPLLASVYQ